MAEQCLMIEEVAYHSETWLYGTGMVLSDGGGRFDEAWANARGFVYADSGRFYDAIGGNRTLMLRDAGQIGEAYLVVGQAREHIREAGRFAERYLSQRSVVVADTGLLAERYDGAVLADVRERGVFSEQYTGTSNAHALVAEVATVSEKYHGVRTAVLADAGQLGEALSSGRSITVFETGVLADLLTAGSNAIMVVREAGRFTDQFSGTGHPVAMVGDTAWLDERYMLPAPSLAPNAHTASRTGPATCWTANTDTWAMSRYAGLSFNSLAVVQGRLMGASDDGLHALEGDTDAGEAIHAHITTPKMAFGGDLLSTMHTLYAGATTDGGLQVTVDVAPHGRPAFYTYPFEARGGQDLAPQRAKLGRGLRSRYWQITVGNTDGAGLLIDSVTIRVGSDARRV